MLDIGTKIKEIRLKRGIKQRHIEKTLGKYSGWLWGVESGNVNLYANDIPALTELLGVEISDIF